MWRRELISLFECVMHITNNLLSFAKAGNVLRYFLQLIMQLCMVVSLFSSDTSKPLLFRSGKYAFPKALKF